MMAVDANLRLLSHQQAQCQPPLQFAILGCRCQFRKVRDMAERQDQDWYPENKKLLIKIGIREITNFSTLFILLIFINMV